MVGIRYTDVVLPKNNYKAGEIIKDIRISDEKKAEFISNSKLDKIYIEEERDEISYFDYLLTNLFDSGEIIPSEIDYLIYTDHNNLRRNNITLPYYFISKYGMSNASVSIIDQGCGTSLQAIQFAKMFIDYGRAKNILILSVSYGWEKLTRYIGVSILGDGAGIMVVSDKNIQSRIIDFKSISRGFYSVERGGADINLGDNTTEIMKAGVKLIKELLFENNLSLGKIRLIIPQSINEMKYTYFSSLLGLELEKLFLDNVPNGGHLGNVDAFRNYRDALSYKGIKSKDKFILYGLGSSGVDTSIFSILLEKM